MKTLVCDWCKHCCVSPSTHTPIPIHYHPPHPPAQLQPHTHTRTHIPGTTTAPITAALFTTTASTSASVACSGSVSSSIRSAGSKSRAGPSDQTAYAPRRKRPKLASSIESPAMHTGTGSKPANASRPAFTGSKPVGVGGLGLHPSRLAVLSQVGGWGGESG